MSEQVAERFIEALGRLEAGRESESIVRLFAADAEVGNVVSPEKFRGREGAREFWGAKYRDTFGEVRSTFRNVFAAGDRAAYEYASFQKAARRAGAAVVLGGAGFREEGIRRRLPADLHAESFRQLEEFAGSLAARDS